MVLCRGTVVNGLLPGLLRFVFILCIGVIMDKGRMGGNRFGGDDRRYRL